MNSRQSLIEAILAEVARINQAEGRNATSFEVAKNLQSQFPDLTRKSVGQTLRAEAKGNSQLGYYVDVSNESPGQSAETNTGVAAWIVKTGLKRLPPLRRNQPEKSAQLFATPLECNPIEVWTQDKAGIWRQETILGSFQAFLGFTPIVKPGQITVRGVYTLRLYFRPETGSDDSEYHDYQVGGCHCVTFVPWDGDPGEEM